MPIITLSIPVYSAEQPEAVVCHPVLSPCVVLLGLTCTALSCTSSRCIRVITLAWITNARAV
jgi:hypothetical protein